MRNNILYLLLYLCLHSFTSKAQNPLTEYVETPDSIRNAKTPGAWYFQAGAVSQQFRFTGQRKEVAIMKFPQTVQPSIAIGRELIFASGKSNRFGGKLEVGFWWINSTGKYENYPDNLQNHSENRFTIKMIQISPAIHAFYQHNFSKNIGVVLAASLQFSNALSQKNSFDVYYFAKDSLVHTDRAELFGGDITMVQLNPGIVFKNRYELTSGIVLVGALQKANYLLDHSRPLFIRLGYRLPTRKH
jgi:hypothetical protein